MWLAALAGRLSALVHTACGHAVIWKTSPPEVARYPGDTLLEDMEHVLRVAVECPSGQPGDDIRRSACELIEASSVRQRNLTRRRMLKTIAQVTGRHSRGRSRDDDPSPLTLRRLTEALRREPRPS